MLDLPFLVDQAPVGFNWFLGDIFIVETCLLGQLPPLATPSNHSERHRVIGFGGYFDSRNVFSQPESSACYAQSSTRESTESLTVLGNAHSHPVDLTLCTKKATTSWMQWSRSRKHQSGGFDEPHS